MLGMCGVTSMPMRNRRHLIFESAGQTSWPTVTSFGVEYFPPSEMGTSYRPCLALCIGRKHKCPFAGADKNAGRVVVFSSRGFDVVTALAECSHDDHHWGVEIRQWRATCHCYICVLQIMRRVLLG